MEISEYFGTKNYECRLDAVQTVCEYCLFFLYECLGQSCPDNPKLLTITTMLYYLFAFNIYFLIFCSLLVWFYRRKIKSK